MIFLLVEVLDAVYLVGCVHSEGNAVQAAATHHTRKALWMVGLARRTQDLSEREQQGINKNRIIIIYFLLIYLYKSHTDQQQS